MSDAIILGAATQQNLLSLQNINQQLSSTQNHLATGLKVASAVDNAVLFFQSQSLTNRATDLSTRKDNIDQGISSLTTATQGIQSAISILQQMQGLLQSAKTETATQRKSAAAQFNTLSVQLNQLLNDSSYQGLNLVNSSTSNLTLQFSDATASKLHISGQNLLMSALMAGFSASKQVAYTGGTSAGSAHSAGSHVSAYQAVAWTGGTAAGSGHSAGSGVSAFKTVAYTGAGSAGSAHSAGSGFSIVGVAYSSSSAGSGHSVGSGFSAGGVIDVKTTVVFNGVKASVQATAYAGVTFSTAVSTNKVSAFDTVYNALNAAISTAQAAAQSLGANVSLLQTRLSFTASYLTTLNGGASKLTVADVNLESTNLVTLQTRQQLAIQSLSIATQSEQAVLRLFH
jgi:flagellin